MDMKSPGKQGALGKDMKPEHDCREGVTGKLPGPDNSMTKSYPKGKNDENNGFPTAYDHALIKTYPKSGKY